MPTEDSVSVLVRLGLSGRNFVRTVGFKSWNATEVIQFAWIDYESL